MNSLPCPTFPTESSTHTPGPGLCPEVGGPQLQGKNGVRPGLITLPRGGCLQAALALFALFAQPRCTGSTAGALGTVALPPPGPPRGCRHHHHHRHPGAFYLVPLAVVDLGGDHGVGVTASQVVTEVGRPMSQLNGGEVRVVDPSHVEEQARCRFCPHFKLNREPGEEMRAKWRTTSVFLLLGPGRVSLGDSRRAPATRLSRCARPRPSSMQLLRPQEERLLRTSRGPPSLCRGAPRTGF